MNIIFFESDSRDKLLPLVFTRPVALLRVGILTIQEKWEIRLEGNYSYNTEDYLSEKYPLVIENDNIFISSHVCPTEKLAGQISILKKDEGICYNGLPIAFRVGNSGPVKLSNCDSQIKWSKYEDELNLIHYPWDMVELNHQEIKTDFELLTKEKESAKISSTNNLIGIKNIFVEEGTKLEFTTINASEGPVYIGRDSEVMEGSLIRGPFALGESSVVNMGSKIYGGTTIGPFSKVGGEIVQSMILGYSNKGHDGFLGHSVLGE